MLPTRVDRLQEAAFHRTRSITIVLDGVHDPRNLSAVVRSAEGFGLLDLHVIETHAPFRLAGKVTQGAEKWLDIHRYPEPNPCFEALIELGFELWLADPDPSGCPVKQVPWQKKVALVFGNEHQGASKRMREKANGFFHIPMQGFSQSLNISVSAGIALAMGVSERIDRLGRHGDLPEDEQRALVAEWQRRSVRCADQILARMNPETTCEDESLESTG